MKLNENEAIATPTVLLVPYCNRHVETYHQWMEDETLRLATASERLTLPEEHAMQQSWRQDRDKLTFIICLPVSKEPSPTPSSTIAAGQYDSADRLIGDVNLFLYENDEDETDTYADSNKAPSLVGEIELMIARRPLRRQGYGRAALLAFLEYILSNWERITAEFVAGGDSAKKYESSPSLEFLRVKINATNEASIRSFRSIGFVQIGAGPNYFGEIEMRWTSTLDDLKRLQWFETPLKLTYE